MRQIAVGLIGAGGMAERHINGIAGERDMLAMQAVCDVEKARADAIAERYHIGATYADYREMLDQEQLDAVIVLAPHDLQEEVCLEAARRGKHILVEKPIARTLDEADRMIEAAHKANVTLMVGHNQRYVPAHRKIKELADENAFGRVLAASADHWEDLIRPPGSWWRSKNAVGGGCLIGSGIHRLDLLRWFLGDPEEIYAYRTYDESRIEGEIAAVVIIRFGCGAIASYLCSWGTRRPWPSGESLSISGTKGGVCYRDGIYYLTDSSNPQTEQKALVTSEGEYESMWRHFALCVRDGSVPLTSGEEGRKALAIVAAAYSSMQSGKPATFTSV